jgi:hypothetical protein
MIGAPEDSEQYEMLFAAYARALQSTEGERADANRLRAEIEALSAP